MPRWIDSAPGSGQVLIPGLGAGKKVREANPLNKRQGLGGRRQVEAGRWPHLPTHSCCLKLRTCRQIPTSQGCRWPLRVRDSGLPAPLLLLLAVGARAQVGPRWARLHKAAVKAQGRRGPGRHLAH